MQWYRVYFSLPEMAHGKHARLQKKFHSLLVLAGEPPDAVLLQGRAPEENTFFFSPGAAAFAWELIRRYEGTACRPPAPSEVELVSGAQAPPLRHFHA